MATKICRVFISAFVIINITAVLVINRSDLLISAIDHYALQYVLPPAIRNSHVRDFFIYYAAYTGLDPRWTMFGRTQIYDWWHVIAAKYRSGKTVVLPIPTQSRGSFMQKTFFDYKEVKFHVNIHASPAGQMVYASYLCRRYPLHEGSPIQSIIMKVKWRTRRDPYDAEQHHGHNLPGVGSKLMGIYPCSRTQE